MSELSREKLTEEKDEIACIIADNFTPEEYDPSDFEWCAHQLQRAGYRRAENIIQEFAERLKRYYNSLKGRSPCSLVAFHIDQIAKEMTGGKGNVRD